MDTFGEFVSSVQRAHLRFLIIGGHAVNAHGYARETQDFDFLFSDRDRFRCDELIRSLGYFPRHVHRVFHMYHSEEPMHPAIDFMFVDQSTFQKFLESSQEADVKSFKVRVPAMLHLLALKLHAERSGGERRAGRDLNDVLHLIKLGGLKLADPEIQEILRRYGTESISRRLSLLLNEPLPAGPGPRPADA